MCRHGRSRAFSRYHASRGAGSAARRKALQKKLRLPEKLSPNALLDVLNALMGREDFLSAAASLLEDGGKDNSQ